MENNCGWLGATGYTGGPGSIGATGPFGFQGIPGEKGSPGYTGFQGNPGPRGNPGFPGQMGASGAPGATGKLLLLHYHYRPSSLLYCYCRFRRYHQVRPAIPTTIFL